MNRSTIRGPVGELAGWTLTDQRYDKQASLWPASGKSVRKLPLHSNGLATIPGSLFLSHLSHLSLISLSSHISLSHLTSLSHLSLSSLTKERTNKRKKKRATASSVSIPTLSSRVYQLARCPFTLSLSLFET